MNDAPQASETIQVECPPTKDPAVRWFIFAAMMLGFAAWTIYDHYIMGKYPYPEPYELNPYMKYLFNHYAAYLLIPPGLIGVVLGARQLMRKLTADAEGIAYGRTEVPWDAIKRLDASQLAEKGILVVHYGDGGALKLDSWKCQNFKQLVALVESKVPQSAREQ